MVPILTEVAIGKREKITVFGNNYNTPDGTCIREYIHVVDIAKSHVKAMDFLINNPGKHAFNVGTGIGVSVLEAIKVFEESNNLSINYTIGERSTWQNNPIQVANNRITRPPKPDVDDLR